MFNFKYSKSQRRTSVSVTLKKVPPGRKWLTYGTIAAAVITVSVVNPSAVAPVLEVLQHLG